MDERIKELLRIGKIVIIIISAIIGLAVLLAYRMSVYFGVPGFKD
jgi:hypothetical protein